MSDVRCPRCKFHADNYKAPAGKCVRNPEADLTKAVYDDCKACDGTGHVPDVVVSSIKKFARTSENAEHYLTALRWSYDHFSFNAHGMYVGVETDGYLHT